MSDMQIKRVEDIPIVSCNHGPEHELYYVEERPYR